MTDEKRDELLRWAAEDVLGWHMHSTGLGWNAKSPSYGQTQRLYDKEDLTGWPGFGLAVEAARAKGLGCINVMLTSTGLWICDLASYATGDERANDGPLPSKDPGIAAWLALREALR